MEPAKFEKKKTIKVKEFMGEDEFSNGSSSTGGRNRERFEK